MSTNFGIILDIVLIKLRISQIDLTKEFGIDKTSISNDKKYPPSRIRLRKYIPFINHYKLNYEFLATGMGELFRIDQDLKEYKEKVNYSDMINNSLTFAEILHVNIAAQAGFANGFYDTHKEELDVWRLPFKMPGYSFEVSGNSMADTLRPGDIIVTSRDLVKPEEIINDYIYVIVNKGEIIVKRVNKHSEPDMLWLESDNEDFDNKEIHFDDIERMYLGRRILKHDLSKKMRYE